MTVKIATLPAGSRGFDANRRLTMADVAAARELDSEGRSRFDFVMRYLRRQGETGHDLTASEAISIVRGGLALGVVQHVDREGWYPGPRVGAMYGATAAEEARSCGIVRGAQLWCDLEGVNRFAEVADIRAYARAWCAAVHGAGYKDGLYVGDGSGLNAQQLYQLPFKAYWGAYNLDKDQRPAVRGLCMRQHSGASRDFLPGFTNQDMDLDTVQEDALGGLPLFLMNDV